MLRAMAGLAAGAGLAHLIAPVRPNLKERYPTIAIGRYAGWTREDGTPFDPWIRVPSRLGTAPDRRRLGGHDICHARARTARPGRPARLALA